MTKIADALSPAFFVSYSRRQERIARQVRGILGLRARDLWLDVEQIQVGDAWRDEVRNAIRATDELVLLLCNDSIQSKVVAEELAIAEALGKLIRPFIVERLTTGVPPQIAARHYIDLTKLAPRHRVPKLQEILDPPSREQDVSTKYMKLQVVRGIWPCFSLAMISANGRSVAGSLAMRLDDFGRRYADASPLRLNTGLIQCLAGNWERGVGLLRSYATAANTQAGWYFLSLHLPRRRSITQCPPQTVREALQAARLARSFGENPLTLLLTAVLEVGGENTALNLRRRIVAFEQAHHAQPEEAPEYLRLLWCLQPSMSALGSYQHPVLHMIERLTT